jgi:hypothetical protein
MTRRLIGPALLVIGVIMMALALSACGDTCPAGQEKVRRPAWIEPVSDNAQEGMIYHRAHWECGRPERRGE